MDNTNEKLVNSFKSQLEHYLSQKPTNLLLGNFFDGYAINFVHIPMQYITVDKMPQNASSADLYLLSGGYSYFVVTHFDENSWLWLDNY